MQKAETAVKKKANKTPAGDKMPTLQKKSKSDSTRNNVLKLLKILSMMPLKRLHADSLEVGHDTSTSASFPWGWIPRHLEMSRHNT